jgi:Novel STAND NTPase 1/SIR2-like domain
MSSEDEASPYKFLDYYDVDDHALFFGRSLETRILVTDVVVGRLVVLFAETGTGKTSLINAGVRPILRDRGYETYFVRVRKDPVASARTELAERTGLTLPDAPLATQLSYVAEQVDAPIVVFFDQFEEFFQYGGKEERTALAFVAEVARIYTDRSISVRLVFSMREEWFAKMDVFRESIPTIFSNESSLRLRWFDHDQARKAIVEPAAARHVEVDRDLQEALLSELDSGGRIEPTQLQIVCDTLWQKVENGRLRLEHYRALGGPGDVGVAVRILDRRMTEELRRLPKAELELCAALLPMLGSDEGTKTLVPVQGLAKTLNGDPDILDSLLMSLENARLIRKSPLDRGREFVELTHDYLVGRLDDLRLRVEGLAALNALDEALADYRESGALLAAEVLADTLERVDDLPLDAEYAELLFRSALRHGLQAARMFELARELGVDVRRICREEIAGGGIDALPAIDMLAELGSDEASALLGEALERKDTGASVVDVLGRAESVVAVDLLARVLAKQGPESPACDALVQLTRSKAADVASRAEDVLLTSLRRADPAVAVGVLARIDSLAAVEFLGELLELAAVSEPAQDALVAHTRAIRPDVARRAAELVVAFVRRAERSSAAVARLGRVETVDAVALLRDLLEQPELADAARTALVSLTGSPSTEVSNRAADAILAALALDAASLPLLGRIDKVAAVDRLAEALKHPSLAADARLLLSRHASSRRPDVAARAAQVLRQETEPPVPKPPPRRRPPVAYGDLVSPAAELVLRALAAGRLVPVLGPGVNLVGRPAGSGWSPTSFLPDEFELAEHLAQAVRFPPDELLLLVTVAQYFEAVVGRHPLYRQLRDVLGASPDPTAVHEFLAGARSRMEQTGVVDRMPPPLIVTTNYDESLERSFVRHDEPYQVVSYIADGDDRGRFSHRSPWGLGLHVIERPAAYDGLDPDVSVILKLRGGVDAADADHDSFVVTADDHADFLAGAESARLIPVQLLARLRRSQFLFLGFSVHDWHHRVLLDRVLGDRSRRKQRSWVVQLDPSEFDRALWRARETEILDEPVEDFVAALGKAVDGID